MANEADSYQALDIANAILMEMAKKDLDPVLSYAALGCAFIQLHQGLGHGKESWLEITRSLAKTAWDEK